MMRFDRVEGEIDMRRVVHRQHDAGDDLRASMNVRMPPNVHQ